MCIRDSLSQVGQVCPGLFPELAVILQTKIKLHGILAVRNLSRNMVPILHIPAAHDFLRFQEARIVLGLSLIHI